MNVIFLDIDGVLNSHLSFVLEGPEHHLSKMNCNFFREAIDSIPDLKIVISSSWRGHGKDRDDFLQFVKNIADYSLFEPIVPFLHDDYATKRLWKKRGSEIEEWLSRHPEVTNYICLDDDSDFKKGQNLLLIDGDIGFSFRDVHILRWFFSVEEPENARVIGSTHAREAYARAREKFLLRIEKEKNDAKHE